MSDFKRLRNRVAKVATSGAGGQVVHFLALPVLSRLYPPDAFGAWALFVSTSLIVAAIGTLRYELAVVLPKRHRPAANVVALGFIATSAFALVSLVLLPIALAWISTGKEGDLSEFGWAAAGLVFSYGAYHLALGWCTRTSQFLYYSIAQFTLPVLTLLVQFTLGIIAETSASGLIIGTVAGHFGATILVWYLVLRRDHRLLASSCSLRRVATMAVRYRNYPLYMTPYTLVSTLRDRAIYLVLGRFSSQTVVGYYSLSHRLTNLPNSLVSRSIRPVLFQQAVEKDFRTLAIPVTDVVFTLGILAVPNLVFFLFFTREIMIIVFGENWAGAGIYAAMLAVPAVPLLMGNWLDRALDTLGRQRLTLMLEVAFSLSLLLVLAASYAATGDVLLTVAAQAATMTLFFCLWIIVLYHVAGFAKRLLLRVAVVLLALSAFCAALLWSLQNMVPAPLAAVLYYCVLIPAVTYWVWRIAKTYRRPRTDIAVL